MNDPTSPLNPDASSAAEQQSGADSENGSGSAAEADGAKPIAVVGLGASAGGLQAYLSLFRALPPDTA